MDCLRDRRAALMVLAFLSGCSTAIEVGQGENVFKPVEGGSTITISCGMLGEKYIAGAVRTQVLDPTNADVLIEIKREDNGAIVCHSAIDSVPLQAARDGWSEFAGIRCFVEDPAALNGKSVSMTGAIRDTNNQLAATSVSFKVASPADNCGG